MKRWIALLALLILLPTTQAYAQQYKFQGPLTVSGVACTTALNVQGFASAMVEADVTGTFVFDMVGSLGGTTYTVIPTTDASSTAGSPATTQNADGKYSANLSGYKYVSFCGVSGAGSASVYLGTITSGGGSGGSASFSGSIGAVTNGGTFVVQENGAALTALQLIDNLPNTLGSTTSGQSGALGLGAVTTAAPTYTTAQSNALSLQTDGSLRTAVTNTLTVGSHAVTNAGVFLVQENGAALTALQLIDNLPNTLGSTTSGQSGALGLGAVTTAAPTYTTAQSNALSLQTDGSLRTAITNTVTISSPAVTNAGTFVTQENGAALTALQLIDNPVGSLAGGAAGTSSYAAGAIYNSTPPTLTNGQQASLQLSSSGALIVTGSAGTTQYAEDAVHSSGDQTVFISGIRRDTTPSSSSGTAGDYSAFNLDANGRLYVNATLYDAAGAALVSNTQGTHDTTLGTITSITGSVWGGYANSSAPTNVTAGDWTVGWFDLAGRAHVTGDASMTALLVTDGSGAMNVICDSGCSGGTQYTQDAALTVGTTIGTMAMGRASAAVPTDVSADNDAVMPWYLRSGAIATQPTYAGVLAVGGSGTINSGVQRVNIATDDPVNDALVKLDAAIIIEDAAETAAANLVGVGSVRRDAAASSAGTTGDNATFNTDALGLLWSRTIDPCTAIAQTSAPISSTVDVAIIAASASNRNYICGITLVAAAAEIVGIWEGTGSACGTGSAAIAGSTTEANGLSLAANGGWNSDRTIRGLSTNVDTCLRISGSNRVSGTVQYVQAP